MIQIISIIKNIETKENNLLNKILQFKKIKLNRKV